MTEIVNKYPVGIQTFQNLREGEYLYVDKTKYIVDFRKKGMKYVFLSRPRRFGKSIHLGILKGFYSVFNIHRHRKQHTQTLQVSYFVSVNMILATLFLTQHHSPKRIFYVFCIENLQNSPKIVQCVWKRSEGYVGKNLCMTLHPDWKAKATHSLQSSPKPTILTQCLTLG